jgi:hypothetical protein
MRAVEATAVPPPVVRDREGLRAVRRIGALDGRADAADALVYIRRS